jgi:hypothetical protein
MTKPRARRQRPALLFLAVSLSLHTSVFIVLIFMPRSEVEKTTIVHPVVIENSTAGAQRKRREAATAAPHNDLTPLLSPQGRIFDPTGIFSLPDSYLFNPAPNLNLARPRASGQRGPVIGPGRFDTGWGSKRYTTIEFHTLKVADILRFREIHWLDDELKCRIVEGQILDFLNDKVPIKTWYTLGIGSRLPDASEKEDLVYYLRRLERRILEEGSQEQAANLAVTYRTVYDRLKPNLREYWDNLTGNYQLLNDPKRSPEF